MDEVDKEISYLEEKVKEFSNESMRLKEKERQKASTPITNRDSGIGASEQVKSSEPIREFGGARPKVRVEAETETDFDYISDRTHRPASDHALYSETPRNVPSNVTTRRFRDNRFETLDVRDRMRKDEKSSKLKPATYDGTTSWLDYKSHFNACACLNHWSEEEKGMYLAVSLRGLAQGVLGNLPEYLQMDFKELCRSLEERFSPANQTELYRAQLRERRQKASETIPQLGQDIRRLTRLAYPTAPGDVCETLAKEYFIDALVSFDMRLRIKQSRPQNLNDAIRHAVELNAFIGAERRRSEESGFVREAGGDNASYESNSSSLEDSIKSIKEMLLSLQTDVNKMKTEQQKPRTYHTSYNTPRKFEEKKQGVGSSKKCFNCGKPGHFKKDCRSRIKSKTNAQQGHSDSLSKSKSGRTIDTGKESSGQFKMAINNESKSKEKHKGCIGIHKKSNEPGMYIRGTINDVPVMTLVDTGATVTLISRKVFDAICMKHDLELNETNQNILSASGTPLNVHGKTVGRLKFGKKVIYQAVIVADMTVDVVLGLDCLKANKGVIDLCNKSLRLGDESHPLEFEGKFGCFRIVASETMTLPSKAEVVTTGKVIVPDNENFDLDVGVVEPSPTFLKSDRGLVGRTLVKGGSTVPVRLFNPSESNVTIHLGTTVGELSPIEDIMEGDLGQSESSDTLPEHLKPLFKNSSSNLSKKQAKVVKSLLMKYALLFTKSDKDVGRTGLTKHTINTGDNRPIKEVPRRLPEHMNAEVDKHVKDMLENNVIEPSNSPWASRVVLVKKKDGSTRFCVDYRRLNAITEKDAYPIPRIDETLDQLVGCKWFSTLDLHSGYWQIEMDPKDKPKTAFVTRNGLYHFNVMPFGLCNAPATFERLMETTLAGLQWDICLIYLDDIIVYAKTFEEMNRNLSRVFEKLAAAGLKLKAKKCTLFAQSVEYLGHVVSEHGISTDPKKTEVIRKWPRPNNVTELRSFLGFCSYYRKFVPNFAVLAKPLHVLTQKGQGFLWSEECQEGFEILREKLTKAPMLSHPDFSKPFVLDTDASDVAIGAILSQVHGGEERVISYASRCLTKAERKYCVTRKELLAIVYFVKYFRHYLYGKPFLVRTDHSSLRWLLNKKDAEGQLARWIETLSTYEIQVQHRPGKLHRNADALSRIPCKQCGSDFCISKIAKTRAQLRAVFEEKDTSSMTLLEIQEQDKDISVVKSWLENNKRPVFEDIRSKGYFLRSLWSQWNRLTLRNGIVCRCWTVLETNEELLQQVIPLFERRNILRHCHDDRTSGHLGVHKTLARVRQRYYWPGLQQDVRQYVTGCDTCTMRKSPNKKKVSPMEIVPSGMPMDRIATDILGELPITEDGNRYILVVSDYFTKWTEAFPMPNMEAKTVAKLIVEEVVTRFGTPRIIHSDQGRQYESELFTEMCRLLGIQKTRTTPYHPQSDGMVERFNRTLTAMLSAYVQENQRDWDTHIPYIMMAYRSAEHKSTGFTPNLLMLGRETSLPVDLMYEMPETMKEESLNHWAWTLREKLERTHSFVRENLETAMNRQKRYHDMKLSWERFKPGDRVFVYFPQKKIGCSPKLTSFWRGPYEVLEQWSDVLYAVSCGRKGEKQIIHCDRLRKKRNQTLNFEDTEIENESLLDEVESENTDLAELTAIDTVEELVPVTGQKRIRKQPKWLQDYEL